MEPDNLPRINESDMAISMEKIEDFLMRNWDVVVVMSPYAIWNYLLVMKIICMLYAVANNEIINNMLHFITMNSMHCVSGDTELLAGDYNDT